MSALTDRQIKAHLKVIPNWSQQTQSIYRTFTFKGFLKGIVFVNRIARRAQRLNHHPVIDINFDRVTLTLTSHDEGGITEMDFSLARQCDEVFLKFFGDQHEFRINDRTAWAAKPLLKTSAK
jgi:4a-hydroxytetrahydrobiopterin dehydratase